MSGTGWAVVPASAVIGLGAGWMLGGGLGAGVGALLGAAVGLVAALLQLRTMVALALVASLAIGAIIGQGIVHALCLPGGCVAAETFGAVVTAIAAVVAMGLVVALVTRSFEEYHEAMAARRPPPEPGCEADELESDAT